MQTFAIIGLGQFGKCMVQSLARRKCEIVVIDHEEKKVDWAKDLTPHVVKADALNFELFTELFPEGLDCAVVDLGERMEPSILVTNHLHKLKVPNIVVQALSPEHSEILQIVGATKVVFPEKEAAERLVGMFVGRGALNFFPVSDDFSVVEMRIPAAWVGSRLNEMDLRRMQDVHVVAWRKLDLENETGWHLPSPDRLFESNDIVLLAGTTAGLRRQNK